VTPGSTRVTIEVTEVREHHGTTIVRGRYDGTYDKSKLPPGDLIAGARPWLRRRARHRCRRCQGLGGQGHRKQGTARHRGADLD
jgi:hypothetical protein